MRKLEQSSESGTRVLQFPVLSVATHLLQRVARSVFHACLRVHVRKTRHSLYREIANRRSQYRYTGRNVKNCQNGSNFNSRCYPDFRPVIYDVPLSSRASPVALLCTKLDWLMQEGRTKTSARHVRETSPCHSPRGVCIRDEFVCSHYILERRK